MLDMEPEGLRWGKPMDDDRGELAPESEVFVRESEPSVEGTRPPSEGVGARSWSEDDGRCNLEFAGSCSWNSPPFMLALEVDEPSRGRPASTGTIIGAFAGVFAPVPADDNEGDPEGGVA